MTCSVSRVQTKDPTVRQSVTSHNSAAGQVFYRYDWTRALKTLNLDRDQQIPQRVT